MLSIWKFPLPVALDDKAVEVTMPEGAAIVRFAGGEHSPVRQPTVWALVDSDNPPEARRFRVFGTGHPLPRAARFVGTFFNEPFVWHVLELIGEALPDGLDLPADAEAAYRTMTAGGFTRRPLTDAEKPNGCGLVGVWVAPDDEPLTTEQMMAVAILQEHGFGPVVSK